MNPDDPSNAPETGTDIVLRPGLSLHFVGSNAGIYCHRLMAGRGFAELPVEDLIEIVERFSTPEGREMLQAIRRRVS